VKVLFSVSLNVLAYPKKSAPGLPTRLEYKK
jgi:hypothetical protein